ncbi:MAG: hypothetical protein GXY40_09150 [Syntrophomonadaceae bacterium]|nr:hypothetical protein [Syntrophomonadaceae bacterium]
MKNKRGQAFIELLLVLPLFLLIFAVIIEMGFIMYDFAVIHYAASTAAVEAARQGDFTTSTQQRTADYLTQWTSNKTVQGVAFAPEYSSPTTTDQIIICAPTSGVKYQRGNVMSVKIIYPVKFKLFFIDSLANWALKEEHLTLKSQAIAMSEEYFEP